MQLKNQMQLIVSPILNVRTIEYYNNDRPNSLHNILYTSCTRYLYQAVPAVIIIFFFKTNFVQTVSIVVVRKY